MGNEDKWKKKPDKDKSPAEKKHRTLKQWIQTYPKIYACDLCSLLKAEQEAAEQFKKDFKKDMKTTYDRDEFEVNFGQWKNDKKKQDKKIPKKGGKR